MGNGEEEGLLSRIGSWFKSVWCTMKCAWKEIIIFVVTLVLLCVIVAWACVVFFVGISGDALLTALLPPGAPIFGLAGIVMILIFVLVLLLLFWIWTKVVEKHLKRIVDCWVACS